MSWLDKIKTSFKITTGDGQSYTPNWMNAVKSVEYNVSEFEFSNISGTLVKRGQPKGTRYNIQIWFQGDDHLDTSEAFEASSADPRYWTISHPMYGRLIVQPVSLEFDNSKYNTTEIRGVVVETITEDFPAASDLPEEQIQTDVAETNAAIASATSQEITAYGIEASSITKQRTFIETMNANANQIISQVDDFDEYYEAYNEALAKVETIASEPAAAMQAAQELISAPASFTSSVRSRISILGNTYTSLASSLTSPLLMDKVLFEANGGTVMSAICLSASTPQESDYYNRAEVLEVVELILSYWDAYLEELDFLQSENGGSPTSYVPSAEAMTDLSQLINYTLGNLFNIALNARQERTLVLEKDSNWVVLAHRLYGIGADDSEITNLIEQNGAGLSEMLQVKKNRVIKYYI